MEASPERDTFFRLQIYTVALESGCVLPGKCFSILGLVSDSGTFFQILWMCFGFWEVFLESGMCFVLANHCRFTCIVYMYDRVGKSSI